MSLDTSNQFHEAEKRLLNIEIASLKNDLATSEKQRNEALTQLAERTHELNKEREYAIAAHQMISMLEAQLEEAKATIMVKEIITN